jgi:hypothetical protein
LLFLCFLFGGRMLFLPVSDMSHDSFRCFWTTEVPSICLHEIILRIYIIVRQNFLRARVDTHEIEEDGMINKVILSRFNVRRSRKVNSKGLTNSFYILPTPSQSNDIMMKLYTSITPPFIHAEHLPRRYFFNDAGSSLAGSQVINNG